MDLVVMLMAASIAAPAGAIAGRWQHLLYRNPDHRVPRRGRPAVVQSSLLATASGVVAALAFRPDHYEWLPASLSALFGVALLVLASTDLERRLLPNRLTYPAILAAIVFAWAWPDRDLAEVAVGASVGLAVGLGLFLLGMLFGAVRGITETPFGFGDSKLIFLLGTLLGWPALGAALIIGILSAGVPGVVMVLLGRGNTVFSYGPFLATGGLVALLFPASFT